MAKCKKCGAAISFFSTESLCESCLKENALAGGRIKYQPFLSHTSVNCDAFIEAGYELTYDDMAHTAYIKDPGLSIIDDPVGKKNTFYLYLRMITISGYCVIYPMVGITCKYNPNNHIKPLSIVYIRTGENRYSAKLTDINSLDDKANTIMVSDGIGCVWSLGLNDIQILREITKRKYDSKIRYGDDYASFKLTSSDIDYIAKFLDTCDKAGVFKQPELALEANRFDVITKYNPD